MNHQPLAQTPSAFYFYQSPEQYYHDPALTSLAYRPLHLSLQQSNSHLQLQHQLSLAQASAGFQHQANNSSFQQHQLPYRIPRPGRTRQPRIMADYQNATTTEEELAELQKLSNEYQPEVTGPLVGQRQPSTAITTEYASADPIFQAKTQSLPQKYSHYRTVRGDGRCGWRAISFGYFEALIHHGDANRFLEEETRLRSSSNILNLAGYETSLFEDFADETFGLLRDIADEMQTGNPLDVLEAAFRDEVKQNYIMTHLKTLTTAWMKTRPQEYAPWLLGQSVEEYCNASVMPIDAEIDNVGLTALKDAFLSPAAITLEVLYLDRSEGSEVNMHRFSPVNHGGFDVGTIRLLYRPGHYDLLYKLQDLPPPPPPMQTYLQLGSQPYHEPVTALGVSDFMTMIPGMSYASPHEGWASCNSYPGLDNFTAHASVQHCTQALPTPAAPGPQPQMQPHTVYVPQTPAHVVQHQLQMPQDLAIRMTPDGMMSPSSGFQQLGGNFRRSKYEMGSEFMQASCQTPFQTAIFRNSHYNQAHFMNPAFQPEEWQPDDAYVTSSSKSSRHRSSG